MHRERDLNHFITIQNSSTLIRSNIQLLHFNHRKPIFQVQPGYTYTVHKMDCRSRNGRLLAISCLATTAAVWYLLAAQYQDLAAGLLAAQGGDKEAAEVVVMTDPNKVQYAAASF